MKKIREYWAGLSDRKKRHLMLVVALLLMIVVMRLIFG